MVNVFVWPLPVTVRTAGSAAFACGVPPGRNAPPSTTAASATSRMAAATARILYLIIVAPSSRRLI